LTKGIGTSKNGAPAQETLQTWAVVLIRNPSQMMLWIGFWMENTQNEVSTCAVKVYLVAENRLLRETLVRLFQKRAGLSVVGESRYSESGMEKIAASQCAVLLLDSPTTAHAASLIDELCERAPQISVVLFGMDEDFDCFLRAVRSGVRGYLLKEASSAEIIATVRGVAQGEAICPPKLCAPLFQLVSREFRQRSGRADYEAGTNYGLTYRQRQLVVLVAKGLTNKEIAASLNLSEFTVKNHIRRILRQVDAQTRYEAVDVIRASGFLPSA
jgi:DNA-binding NarL/FixJ family response regulator